MYDDWPVTLTRYEYQPNNLAGFRRVLEPIAQAMNHDEVERDVAAKLWPADGFCASVEEVDIDEEGTLVIHHTDKETYLSGTRCALVYIGVPNEIFLATLELVKQWPEKASDSVRESCDELINTLEARVIRQP